MGDGQSVSGQDRAGLVRPYLEAWREKMVEIWCDRMDMLGIHDTFALRNSVREGMFMQDGDKAEMTFHYLNYGIYVDMGVGNGYTRGNGGDLKILDTVYRHEHKLDVPRRSGRKADGKMTSGNPRERRPWFSLSWSISVEVLKRKIGELMGEEFSNMFDTLDRR